MSADFFAPMSDIQSDIMQRIDPLLLTEDGYQRGAYEVGPFDTDMGPQTLGAAPVDPMYPGDIFTPVMDIYGGGGHLGGVSDAMDIFNVARFLFEGR